MFCYFISLVLLPSFLASVAAQASKSSSASVVVVGQAPKSSGAAPYVFPQAPKSSPKSSSAVPYIVPRAPKSSPKSSSAPAVVSPQAPKSSRAPAVLFPQAPKLSSRPPRNLTAIIAGAGSAVLVTISLSIVLLVAKLRRTRVQDDDEGDYARQVPGMPVRISYEELRLATGDFSERLGGGGFGSVYKGVLRDGTLIAVKRLDKIGRDTREFLAEVETIGSIHHFNLVRLIGFCAEKSRSLLVYEYMCNGSLDNWIFYRDQRPCLDWETRKNVVLDIAKGLTYLHEDCRQRIIHLDIKPQNILLDENFSAKISDFGLSKLIDRDESQVLTTLRGTPGYIAPECGHSRITVQADTYSFGIVLLEIVTGRRNLDREREESSKHLLYLLQRKAAEGEDRILDIVEDLEAEEVEEYRVEMERMIRIAVWCLQNDPTRRPLMSAVVKALEWVIEVDPNITYKFTHALGGSPLLVTNEQIVSAAPQASVLSNPR